MISEESFFFCFARSLLLTIRGFAVEQGAARKRKDQVLASLIIALEID